MCGGLTGLSISYEWIQANLYNEIKFSVSSRSTYLSSTVYRNAWFVRVVMLLTWGVQLACRLSGTEGLLLYSRSLLYDVLHLQHFLRNARPNFERGRD